jgi:hypothetical protein
MHLTLGSFGVDVKGVQGGVRAVADPELEPPLGSPSGRQGEVQLWRPFGVQGRDQVAEFQAYRQRIWRAVGRPDSQGLRGGGVRDRAKGGYVKVEGFVSSEVSVEAESG